MICIERSRPILYQFFLIVSLQCNRKLVKTQLLPSVLTISFFTFIWPVRILFPSRGKSEIPAAIPKPNSRENRLVFSLEHRENPIVPLDLHFTFPFTLSRARWLALFLSLPYTSAHTHTTYRSLCFCSCSCTFLLI